MATAVSTKPSQGIPKMKRPPPPALQTSVNGVNASNSSPSPSLASKRLPSASKQPPGSAGGNGSTVNGVGPRASTRQRKDTQKMVNGYSKSSRAGSLGGRGSTDLAEQDALRLAKLPPQPYGRSLSDRPMGRDRANFRQVPSTAHILKKYKGHPPSLILHLHPTHFRFDQQDGSFGYNSPMRPVLEHVRNQTIPHDILEELFASRVNFYDGHLIVQIHDHRSIASSQDSPSTTTLAEKKATPFSVHNYNEHLTPSPYVPYPISPKRSQLIKDSPQPVTNNQSRSTPGTEQTKTQESAPKESDKAQDGDVAAGTSGESTTKPAKIFTTVLHPTPLSLNAEKTILAATPDWRGTNRRPGMYGLAGQSSSIPPTPMSAAPPSARSNNGPPQKRQKMLLDETNHHDFESEVIRSTASPLFLEPANDRADAINIVKALRHPLHQSKPPPPPTRKRTVAELAADEALAAEEERFMLLMDERLASAVSGTASGGKSATVDGQTGSVAFEPRFSRFKTLDHIKEEQKKVKEEKERLAQQAEVAKREQQARQAQEQQRLLQEQQEKERREQEEKARVENARREAYRQNLAARAAAEQQAAQQRAAQLQAAQAAQGQSQANGIGQGPQQHHLHHVSQAPHSSPSVSQSSPPRISSPMVNNVMASHAPGGVPMNVTSSNRGPASPARSASAAQHRASNLAHPMSMQHSQQGPSRHGTPQSGHPATSTPRMSQASPVPGAAARTPMMHPNMLVGTPQMQDNRFSPQQRQHMMQMHHQQQQQQHQQQQQQQQQHAMHGSPQQNMAQPTQQQQLAAFQAAQLRHRAAQQQQQQPPTQQQLDQRQQFSSYEAQQAALAQQMQAMANNTGQQQGSPGGNQMSNGMQQAQQNQNELRQLQQAQASRNQQYRPVYEVLNVEQQQMFRQMLTNHNGIMPPGEMAAFKGMASTNVRSNMTPQQQQQHLMRMRARAQMGANQGRGGMIPSVPGLGAMPGHGQGQSPGQGQGPGRGMG
ncbi:MAG: hypothetical protein M4579_004269 [Chaenotheca gracillima]|nr:MAG: hypothetical protein M4579_004269 [Chaenotheca gracillima]